MRAPLYVERRMLYVERRIGTALAAFALLISAAIYGILLAEASADEPGMVTGGMMYRALK